MGDQRDAITGCTVGIVISAVFWAIVIGIVWVMHD